MNLNHLHVIGWSHLRSLPRIHIDNGITIETLFFDSNRLIRKKAIISAILASWNGVLEFGEIRIWTLYIDASLRSTYPYYTNKIEFIPTQTLINDQRSSGLPLPVKRRWYPVQCPNAVLNSDSLLKTWCIISLQGPWRYKDQLIFTMGRENDCSLVPAKWTTFGWSEAYYEVPLQLSQIVSHQLPHPHIWILHGLTGRVLKFHYHAKTGSQFSFQAYWW